MGNLAIQRHQGKIFYDGLCDQGTVERVPVNGFQNGNRPNVRRTKRKRCGGEPLQSVCPPDARIADIEFAFHAFQQDFPVRKNAQDYGPPIDLTPDLGADSTDVG